MIPIKINGKESLIPGAWDELTIGQYIEISINTHRLNQLRLFSIISGINYALLLNLPEDGLDVNLDQILFWFNEPFDPNLLDRSETITINGKIITPPNDPGKKTLGQKLFLQSKVREAQSADALLCTIVSDAVAIYLQPMVDDAPFNDERAMELKTELLKLPITLIYPWGCFFLSGYIKYVELNMNIAPLNLLTKRSEQEQKSLEYLQSSEHTMH